MKIFILLLCIVLIQKDLSADRQDKTIFVEWNTLEKNIRDNKVSDKDAKEIFSKLIIKIKSFADSLNPDYSEKWNFPVSGYSANTIGKGGYNPQGYNFFDGNKHGGHAAYDIFIYDNNQDCIDDKTKKAVNIIAPVDLLVLSINTGWEKTSLLKGGNYILAYNPKANMIFYFAHLDSVKVTGGTIAKKGSILATLGRTGKNAYPKRSPTHLHFMVLKIKGNELIPVDYYKMISR